VAKSTVRILAVLSGCEIIGEMHLPEGTKDGILGYMKLRDNAVVADPHTKKALQTAELLSAIWSGINGEQLDSCNEAPLCALGESA
jgi:hypothetical protein